MSVVHHAGRVLALAAKAHLASQHVLDLDDMTAFDLARKSMCVSVMMHGVSAVRKADGAVNYDDLIYLQWLRCASTL